jgi:hypothetical protein
MNLEMSRCSLKVLTAIPLPGLEILYIVQPQPPQRIEGLSILPKRIPTIVVRRSPMKAMRITGFHHLLHIHATQRSLFLSILDNFYFRQ